MLYAQRDLGPRLKSAAVFRRRGSGEEIQALKHVRISASSLGLGWRGLMLDVNESRGWRVDELMVAGHCVVLNLAPTPLEFEVRNDGDWRFVRMQPSTFWINPEGRPFSVRHDMNSYVAHCVVDGSFLDAVAGSHYELEAKNGVADEVLACLMRALVANLTDKRRCSAQLADHLIHAFVYALASAHGAPVSGAVTKGGIAPAQLKSLLLWLEEHLDDAPTVSMMAARVGLSAAHFSREFKRSTGISPWEYVVQLRLDMARKLLEAGESITSAALRVGFCDQSHLSRVFRDRFGFSPAVYARSVHSQLRPVSDEPKSKPAVMFRLQHNPTSIPS